MLYNMIRTKYNDKISQKHKDILIDAIQHEHQTGRYEEPEPIQHRITLSEAINALPSSRAVLVAQPNVGQNILKAKQVKPSMGLKALKGGGKSAVVYKKQVPVIGGNNVDFK